LLVYGTPARLHACMPALLLLLLTLTLTLAVFATLQSILSPVNGLHQDMAMVMDSAIDPAASTCSPARLLLPSSTGSSSQP
jgi:hypothetical protein